MNPFRLIVAVTVTVALTAATAHAAKPAKKQGQFFKGTVTEVTKKDDNTGTLTVQVQARKKDTGTTETSTKKFTVTKDTKFEQLSGTKGAIETKPGTFADVKKDTTIAVETKADKETAEKVSVRVKKKKVKTN